MYLTPAQYSIKKPAGKINSGRDGCNFSDLFTRHFLALKNYRIQ